MEAIIDRPRPRLDVRLYILVSIAAAINVVAVLLVALFAAPGISVPRLFEKAVRSRGPDYQQTIESFSTEPVPSGWRAEYGRVNSFGDSASVLIFCTIPVSYSSQTMTG
ncbi:MAG: hypothetical protein AABZ39_14930 [Spirochaetota bacterium]